MPQRPSTSCKPSRGSPRTDAAGRSRRWRGRLGLLLLLVLLAAALRLYGIGWGLPNPGRYYPYHPDETVVMNAIERLGPFRGDFLPSFYNYPSLYLLLCRVAIDLAAGYGAAQPYWLRDRVPMAAWVGDFARLFLIGRLAAVAL